MLILTGATADPYRVTGGGSALQAGAVLKALKESLKGDEAIGVDVFADALSSPLYWIATNAGLDGSVVVNKLAQLGSETQGGQWRTAVTDRRETSCC
ncbi:MAG: groEL [Mycobacterium sp.]|nr:groEL [Mycobacterium sp.]MCW2592891.1 groEL [Mycobacterium sp.]MDT5212849.1 chaperonin GroEL [Mycobacterium sp.]